MRDKVIYTARTETRGSRDNGNSRSSDGLLDVRLSAPGSARIGTNPEQLFAAGWSASFASAIELAASDGQIALPAKVGIDAEVDLIPEDTGHFLDVRFNVTIPGLKRHVAKHLIDEARKLCPYSKATRGNVEVTVTLV